MPATAGLFIEPAQVEFHRRFADAKRFRDFGRATDLDDGQQHAKFGRSQPIGADQRLGRRLDVELGPLHEQRRDSGGAGTHLPPEA